MPLQLNLVRRDTAEFVEGGDEMSYDAIISHNTRSQADCAEGSVFLPLDNCTWFVISIFLLS